MKNKGQIKKFWKQQEMRNTSHTRKSSYNY
jgi:hypothetical protein